jgi:hypothetical protein
MSNLKYFYLEFREMVKDHKPLDSECYAPSSDPIRFYIMKPVSETCTAEILVTQNFSTAIASIMLKL